MRDDHSTPFLYRSRRREHRPALRPYSGQPSSRKAQRADCRHCLPSYRNAPLDRRIRHRRSDSRTRCRVRARAYRRVGADILHGRNAWHIGSHDRDEGAPAPGTYLPRGNSPHTAIRGHKPPLQHRAPHICDSVSLRILQREPFLASGQGGIRLHAWRLPRPIAGHVTEQRWTIARRSVRGSE